MSGCCLLVRDGTCRGVEMDIIATARNDGNVGRLAAAGAADLAARAGLDVAQLMLRLIPLAGERAWPALSNYRVGAVGEGVSGDLYFGANFEMPAGPLSFTVHGEQAVVVNALIHGERGLQRLAISAAPCGVCRQFLYELAGASELKVLLADSPPVRLVDTLPQAFGPADLGIEGRLMASEPVAIGPAGNPDDPLAQAACSAASRSYVPYTGSAAGIALRLADGAIHSGFAIENAAFNPSLIPLQVGLIALAMAGGHPGAIVEAVQVEVAGSKVAFAPPTESLLQRIAPDCRFTSLVAGQPR